MKQFLITLTMLTTLALTSNHLVSSVNKTTIENNLNYKGNDSYNGFLSNYNNYSDVYSIIKGSDYEKDGNTFATSYSTFNFDNDSYLKVSTNSGKKNVKFLNSQVTTAQIKVESSKDIDNCIFTVSINTGPAYDPNSPSGTGTAIEVTLKLGHDNNNIYGRGHISTGIFLGSTSYADIKLNNIIFNKQK